MVGDPRSGPFRKRLTQRRGDSHRPGSKRPTLLPAALGTWWTGLGGAVALLTFWMGIGTAGYMLIEGWSFLDALYQAVITLSTVGFEEHEQFSELGQAFTIVFIIGGLSTVIYAFTTIGRMVIEGELLDIMGMRRMRRELDNLENHWIVCGYGRTSRPVAQGLDEEGQALCVIDEDPGQEAELQEEGLLYVLGDATEEETLITAGIERAQGMLALLPSDADNLYLTMTAKGLNPEAKVIARASDEHAGQKMRRVGADEVVAPSTMVGQRVLQAALRPTVVEFMELMGRREHLQLSLEEVRVADASDLSGVTLADAELRRRSSVIIVAIKRGAGEMVFNPKPADVIQAGDVLVALGERGDLNKLQGICAGPG